MSPMQFRYPSWIKRIAKSTEKYNKKTDKLILEHKSGQGRTIKKNNTITPINGRRGRPKRNSLDKIEENEWRNP